MTIFSLPNSFWKTEASLPTWLTEDLLYDIESEIKYEGYIKRHLKELKQIQKNEKLFLPNGLKYNKVPGLSSEAIEKLSIIKPENLGQAKRVSGITPSDIAVLNVHLLRK